MNLAVVDASVAIKWFLPEPLSKEAEGLLAKMGRGTLQLAAPELICYEVGSVLRKRVRNDDLWATEARALLTRFLTNPIEMVPGHLLAQEAVRIALETHQTVYDGAYLALAQSLACPFITADKRLATALAGSPYQACIQWLGAMGV